MPSATNPATSSSAPNHTKAAAPSTCTKRNCGESSVVGQAAKKLGTAKMLRRLRGKSALRVSSAPTRLSTRKVVGTRRLRVAATSWASAGWNPSAISCASSTRSGQVTTPMSIESR